MAAQDILGLSAASGGEQVLGSSMEIQAAAATETKRVTLTQLGAILASLFDAAGAATTAQAAAEAASVPRPAVTTDSGANRTLALTDAWDFIRMTSASANTVTVPLNSSVAFPIGTEITVIQGGAGSTSFVATGGVTINSSILTLRAQYSAATLIKVATDTWDLIGDLLRTPIDFLARTLVSSSSSGTDLTFNVNNTSYATNANFWFGIDLDAFMPTHFKIVVINGDVNEAGQTVTLQLATAASASAVIHTGGNDIVIDDAQDNVDSGWRTFDNPNALTGPQILGLAIKGSTATVDLVFRSIEIQFKR